MEEARQFNVMMTSTDTENIIGGSKSSHIFPVVNPGFSLSPVSNHWTYSELGDWIDVPFSSMIDTSPYGGIGDFWLVFEPCYYERESGSTKRSLFYGPQGHVKKTMQFNRIINEVRLVLKITGVNIVSREKIQGDLCGFDLVSSFENRKRDLGFLYGFRKCKKIKGLPGSKTFLDVDWFWKFDFTHRLRRGVR